MTVVHPLFTFRFHPRTGSTATAKALMTLPHTKRLEHHSEGVAGPVTACVIRNPLDMMASWFALYTREASAKKSLSQWCRTLAVQAFVGSGPPRMFYHLPTDHVLIYDYLEVDLNLFLLTLGLPAVELELTDPTTDKRPWREYFDEDPDAEGILRARFPLDFAEWEQRYG